MKNHLITALFSMAGMLMAQNFPILTGFLVYIIFAFLVDKYVVKVGMDENVKMDGGEIFLRFFFGAVWPVSFFMLGMIEYPLFKKVYNLPSIRNPFYWPEK
jgi:hypothetical protein